MPPIAWIDGQYTPLENARVSIFDHAHLYGDGLFEGIRIYRRKVFKLQEHLDRLYHGIAFLGYEMPYGKDELREQVLATCRTADLESGYIRLNVTRGTGLGLDPRGIDRRANVVIAVSKLALYPDSAYEDGLRVVTCATRVIQSDALDPRLKCIGRYASNIMAKQEANRAGAGEGMMLNAQGHIAECTGDNIFLIQHGIIKTPLPSAGILKGITRDTVIEIARRMGLPVEETILSPYDVFASEEAFLTGTAAEVIPMVTLDDKPIGTGRPGPITLRLMHAFHEETENGTPF